MRIAALIALIALSFSTAWPALGAERLAIEPCAYPDDNAVSAAWQPSAGTDPAALAPERTPDGKPALAFRCDMARQRERTYWDRQVTLDLSRFGRIAFWAKAVGDVSAIRSTSIYFNAGGGWYATSFPLPDEGWSRIVLDRAAFNIEGTPEGWHAIRTIRVGAWKGQDRQATFYLGAMEALSSDVVIVRNARARSEGITFAERMASLLEGAGIEAGTVDDADVEAGVLAGKRIAIYPHNPQTTDREMDAVEAFVREGGRLLVCYSLSPRLAALLGIEPGTHMPAAYPGNFSRWRFVPGAPPGIPREVAQDSWNIQRVRVVGPESRVLATWLDSKGKDTGCPAIVLGPVGAYVSHVVLTDDRANKERVLLGLLGHLWPGLWEQAASHAIAGAGRLSRWDTFAPAEAGVRETAARSGRLRAVQRALGRARRAYRDAEAYLAARQFPQAIECAAVAREQLLAAYTDSQPTRRGEFRGVWCHSAYGVSGLTWDASIRRLKESGFNAVVPNMLWGGVADYQSRVLPVRDRVAREGDQIALCAAAGRKYGVEVHVWKVNWNLSGAPKEFVDRMRAEGRLQRTDRGEEELWLCPSNPANFELERDSMLEVVRRYPVDGIHFDYIRYPGQHCCYCDPCRRRFEERAGVTVADWPRDVLQGGPHFEAYQEFRRQNITRLVKAVSEEARRIRPDIKISAAVFQDWPQCREHVGQDWAGWIREGYLDFVCPMDYTSSNSGFRSLVRVQKQAVAGRIPLYPGIGAAAPGLPLDQVIDQIQIARAEGADGFIVFDYNGEVARSYIPALGRATTKGTTVPPHRAARR